MAKAWVHRALCVAFAAAAFGAYLCAALPPGSRGGAYLALHVLLSGLMLSAWATADGSASERRWTVAAGILARLALLAVPAFTTHDVQRYLWDGRVLWEGFDPYRLPAGAPELAHLRQAWPTPPEHLGYETLYPPAAMALFAACAGLGPALAPWAWKLAVTAASVATVALGAKLCAERGAGRHLSLLSLSPLSLLESGVGAHLDAFTGLTVAAALLAFHRGRLGWAGVAIGAGGLLKLLPLLLLVALVPEPGGGRRWRLVLAALGVFGAGYAAMLALGILPPGSLGVFFEKWRFGSPVFTALSTLFGGAALYVAAGLLGVGLLLLAWLGTRRPWPSRASAALALPLALSPVSFPWYLVSLVPVLAIAPAGWLVAWMTTAPFTYEVIDPFDAGAGWAPARWPLWLMAFACGLAALAERLVRRNSPASTLGLRLRPGGR